jgi:Bax protein
MNYKNMCLSVLAIISLFLYQFISSDDDHKDKIISVADKKAYFHKIILPAIDEVFDERMLIYKEIKVLEKNNAISEIQLLIKRYNSVNLEELKERIYPHPKSIAIAQAAMESAWGTSRFAKEANNYFGVWSFSKKDDRISANEKRGSKTIWLKKYSSVSDSVRDYYNLISNGKAFKEFNRQKLLTKNPFELVKYLDKYSEKGAEYGSELTKIINYNGYISHDTSL